MGKQLSVRPLPRYSPTVPFGCLWKVLLSTTPCTCWLAVLGCLCGDAMAHLPPFSNTANRTNNWCCENVTGSTTRWCSLVVRDARFCGICRFMMVEKFEYSVGDISLLFTVNYVFNLFFAPRIGKWIHKVGDRTALLFIRRANCAVH